jgi:DNA polymerase-4
MTLPPRSAADTAAREAWAASSLRVLYLDLNSFFASVEQQDNPDLRNRPVIVVPVMSDTTSAIAASIEAKQFGIKTGTPVWEAKQKCPGIGIVNARHDRYVEVHELIKQEIDNHIPVFKTWSIDEVSCELMGPQRLKANAIELAGRIRAGLRANKDLGECMRCSIGIAPNQFLAKLASDMQKPDGLTVIEQHELPARLLPLKLRDLPGIGPNMEKRLNDAGIGSIAELWAIEAEDARRIWGSKEGPAFIQRMRGIGDYEQTNATRSISHEHVLPPQHRDEESARLIARRLGVKGGARLRRMGFVAGNLGLKVRFDNEERWSAEFRLTQTQDNFVILDGIDRLWTQMLRETGAGKCNWRGRFMKVGMWLTQLTPKDDVTLDLFGGASGLDNDDAAAAARREKLWSAMDALNQKYKKKDTVQIGALPKHKSDFMGAKIAFNRIPQKEEFNE